MGVHDAGEGRLEVRLAQASGLADAPSAYTIEVINVRTSEPAASDVVQATADDDGRVVFSRPLPADVYRVVVAQRGCQMSGRSCPDEADDPAFIFTLWSCALDVDVVVAERQRVLVSDGPESSRTDLRVCALD